MKELHLDIAESLSNGAFIKNLNEAIGKNLSHLGLWGTEPATTLRILSKKLNDITKAFPKIEKIDFSTSLVFIDPIVDFIQAMDRICPEIKLGIQISLDGPAFITDENRFKGAAQKIPENFIKLIKKIQKIQLKINFRWKVTLMIDNIRKMIEESSGIDDFYLYFKDINNQFSIINKNKNIKLEEESYVPTLTVPGKYTTEDGKAFATFLKKIHEKNHESSYTYSLKRIVNFYYELSNKRTMFTCCAADSSIGVSDKIHICHHGFYLDKEKYIKSVLAENDMNNWSVSYFNEGMVNVLIKWYTPEINDNFAKNRLFYVMRGYHDFWRIHLANVSAITKELALVGQTEKLFLKNENYLNLFSLFINIACSCPIESFLNTGSIHLTPISLIRMFGNGAFREILKTI
ncbi:MAG: hypothetical protein WC242_05310 [Candidatus Paceibacterota bacterium]|jgi:sulfatase maturation enzyme AslB (radical SAM superfamily)